MDQIEFLVEKGANDFEAGLRGECQSNNPKVEVIEYFLSKGASVMNDFLKVSALELFSNPLLSIDLLRASVERGSLDLNWRDQREKETLFHALIKNPACNLEMVEYAVNKGANLKERGERGKSCLMMAVGEENAKEVLNFLLENGEDVNYIAEIDGITALHLAARFGDLDVVQFLVSKGAKISTAKV